MSPKWVQTNSHFMMEKSTTVMCVRSFLCFSTSELLAIGLVVQAMPRCPPKWLPSFDLYPVLYAIVVDGIPRLTADSPFSPERQSKCALHGKITSHHGGEPTETRAESFLAVPLLGAICFSVTTFCSSSGSGFMRCCCLSLPLWCLLLPSVEDPCELQSQSWQYNVNQWFVLWRQVL